MWRPIAVSKNRSHNFASGMTLVEVLLAVTLFSTMMGATGALLQAGFRAQSLWGMGVEPVVRLERALNRLDVDITSAQKLFSVPVKGTKDQFEFARVESISADETVPSAEWVRVAYKIEQQGDLPVFVREASVWRLSQTSPNPQSREVLLSGAHVTWAFARVDKQGQLLWTDTWDGNIDGVPKLVRLTCALLTATGNPLTITRVFRNPAGNQPLIEEK